MGKVHHVQLVMGYIAGNGQFKSGDILILRDNSRSVVGVDAVSNYLCVVRWSQ